LLLDVRHYPCLVEIALRRTVKAKIGEPPFVWQSLYPVLLRFPDWGLRAEIKINRPVGILGDITPRGAIGLAATID
jgi:hypothetical protein